MEHYVAHDRESLARWLDNSTNTMDENETASTTQEWGLREWLIVLAFAVLLFVIFGLPRPNDETEVPSQESNENENAAPVEKKHTDESTRKDRILNLFVTENNQQKLTSDQIRSKSSRTIDTGTTAEECESSVDSRSHAEDVNNSFDEEEGLVVLSSVCDNNDTNVPPSNSDVEKNEKSVPNLCAICLEEYHDGEMIVWASNKKCPHAFHRDCLVSYLAKVKVENEYPCPCCRQNFFCVNTTITSANDESVIE